MTITEFENVNSRRRYLLIQKYRLEKGGIIVNFLDKQEADLFYLWLKQQKIK